MVAKLNGSALDARRPEPLNQAVVAPKVCADICTSLNDDLNRLRVAIRPDVSDVDDAPIGVPCDGTVGAGGTKAVCDGDRLGF